MMTEAQFLPGDRTESVLEASRIVRAGGVVIIPTDTVYGLAASVYQPPAIDRIFALKRRPPDLRLPVLIATTVDLQLLVREIPRPAWQLIDRFWPGPLTLVLPARSGAPLGITRGGPTVAVRLPAGRTCLLLLQQVGEPLVGTSANISGRPAVTTAAGAADQLGGGVDAILAADGEIKEGVASTVVDASDRAVTVHRSGAISVDQIREALGVGVPVQARLTSEPNRG